MGKIAQFIFLFALLSGLFLVPAEAQTTLPVKSITHWKVVPANDSNVEYIGRTLEKEGTVQFDWTGIHLRTEFSGGYLAVRMSDTRGNYYDLFIDGQFSKTFQVSSDTVVTLASHLSTKIHQLLLYKRTEGEQGMTSIYHFLIAKNGILKRCSNTPVRKIEFIGNSITCGFGTEVADPKASFLPSTENSYHGYASIVSRYFDADYHLVAHSGQGVVRNYGDENSISKVTMRQRFFQTFDMNPDVKWDFAAWQPDVVVIKLGTNDLSNPVISPTKEQFVAGYLDLIASVRKAYGNVPVICLSSCMSGEKLYQYVQQAVEQSNDKNVHFIGLMPALLNIASDFGACFHPNYEGQKKIASILIPNLSTIMGWPLSNKVVE